MPPCVKSTWEQTAPFIQAHLIAFNQRREYDEIKEKQDFLKATTPKAR